MSSEAATADAPKPKFSDRTKAERKLGLMLCAPAVIAMLLVTAYPIIYAVVLSLQQVDLRFPDEGGFVGFENYCDRPQLAALVGERLQHRLHHHRLGRDRARPRNDHRAGDVQSDLRPRPGSHLGPDPLRDHHRRRRVRLVLRLRPGVGLRQRPAVRRRRQGLVRRSLERDGGDHRRRGLEDDPVHRPAAARRDDDDRRRALRGGEGRWRQRLEALLEDHRCR